MTAVCPACDARSGVVICEIPDAPAMTANLIFDADASANVARGRIDLRSCNACGFMWNASFDESLPRYDESYEGTQAHSPRFMAYLTALARSWLALSPKGAAASVLEVGCGQGEFLAALAAETSGEVIGYDPAFRGDAPDGARIVPTALPDAPALSSDIVCSRMTLEHVADPAGFLRLQAGWMAPGGLLITQIPNCGKFIREAAPWEVSYEHANYFSEASLAALSRKARLVPVAFALDFGGQHLSVIASREPGPAAIPAPPPAAGALSRSFATFRDTWRSTLGDEIRAGRDVWLWGAGTRAAVFMNLLGADEMIAGVIDVNPMRDGSCIPGVRTRTFAPSAVAGRSDIAILIMNPIYDSEIRAMAAQLGVEARFILLG